MIPAWVETGRVDGAYEPAIDPPEAYDELGLTDPEIPDIPDIPDIPGP